MVHSSGAGQAPPITVPMYGLARYLRARVEVLDGVLRWWVPRTVLGVLPIGVRRVAVPIEDVESAVVRRVVLHPVRLLVGAVFVVMPWFWAPWWAALPIVIAGLWVALVSFGPHLEVVTKGGTRHRVAVCFGHQLDAELYAAAVNDLAMSS